jgi:hypothetical protein
MLQGSRGTSKTDPFRRRQRTILAVQGKAGARTDRERRKFLAYRAGAEGISFLDLARGIHAAGVDNACIPGNWHWDATGNRVAAEQLHALLKAHVIK